MAILILNTNNFKQHERERELNMYKRLFLTAAVLFVLASLVAACGAPASAATQQPAATQAPAATAAPAATTVPATAVPVATQISNQKILTKCGEKAQGGEDIAYVSFQPSTLPMVASYGFLDKQHAFIDLSGEHNILIGTGEVAELLCGSTATELGQAYFAQHPDIDVWVNGSQLVNDVRIKQLFANLSAETVETLNKYLKASGRSINEGDVITADLNDTLTKSITIPEASNAQVEPTIGLPKDASKGQVIVLCFELTDGRWGMMPLFAIEEVIDSSHYKLREISVVGGSPTIFLTGDPRK